MLHVAFFTIRANAHTAQTDLVLVTPQQRLAPFLFLYRLFCDGFHALEQIVALFLILDLLLVLQVISLNHALQVLVMDVSDHVDLVEVDIARALVLHRLDPRLQHIHRSQHILVIRLSSLKRFAVQFANLLSFQGWHDEFEEAKPQ